MAILSSWKMSYNGIKSEDMGMYHGTVGTSGMLEENFLPVRSMITERIRGKDKSYFMDVEYENLEFDITLIFDRTDSDYWTDNKIREIARWLFSPTYPAELYFTNDYNQKPERIFYGLFVGDSKLIHNGYKQGYINLHFESNSPYSYSPYIESEIYNQINSDNPINYSITDLSNGIFNNTIINGGNVQLKGGEPTWLDDTEEETWLDD